MDPMCPAQTVRGTLWRLSFSGQFCRYVKVLLVKVLLNHAQDLVLLRSLPRDVQVDNFRIRNASLSNTVGAWTTLSIGNTCETSTVLLPPWMMGTLLSITIGTLITLAIRSSCGTSIVDPSPLDDGT